MITEARVAQDNVRAIHEVARMEEELRSIHRVATKAFQKSFLYTPISYETFQDLYLPLLSVIDPEHVLLACRGKQVIGFVFGIPNFLEANCKTPVATFIVKTLAVLPDRTYAGLGKLLWDRLGEIASEKGYLRAINALVLCARVNLS